MTSLKYPRWDDPGIHPSQVARRLAAAALRQASAGLARLARRLAVPATPATSATFPAPQLEFYAEAGAPEGALFAGGVLVGRIEGIRRL